MARISIQKTLTWEWVQRSLTSGWVWRRRFLSLQEKSIVSRRRRRRTHQHWWAVMMELSSSPLHCLPCFTSFLFWWNCWNGKRIHIVYMNFDIMEKENWYLTSSRCWHLYTLLPTRVNLLQLVCLYYFQYFFQLWRKPISWIR